LRSASRVRSIFDPTATSHPELSLNLDERDRGRLVLATVITLLALPTIWLANRDEDGPSSSRPNVAVVGIDPGEADDAAAAEGAAEFDPMGESDAMYLEAGTTVVPPDSVVVIVGSDPNDQVATGRAIYRRSVQPGTCLFNGIRGGEDVTVVNVANGRSIECVASPYQDVLGDMLVLNTVQFQRIADLTAAPIHVEIRR
jgi:hypothetical protein